MEGKYIIEVKAYDKKYGMVSVRKVFKGNKKKAYEDAMVYAFKKASSYSDKGANFTVTIKGEGWRTAAKVNPEV